MTAVGMALGKVEDGIPVVMAVGVKVCMPNGMTVAMPVGLSLVMIGPRRSEMKLKAERWSADKPVR